MYFNFPLPVILPLIYHNPWWKNDHTLEHYHWFLTSGTLG
jgi:hypothetical protein